MESMWKKYGAFVRNVHNQTKSGLKLPYYVISTHPYAEILNSYVNLFHIYGAAIPVCCKTFYYSSTLYDSKFEYIREL